MRKPLLRWIQRGAGLIGPLPSLFDLAIAGFLGIVFIRETYIQSIFFIFYIIFLYSMTIGLTYQRKYQSTPLCLLVLWSLAGVFIHSYFISEQSITFKYLNMYLMSEGFIFILFGAIFIKIVATYSKNLKFLYFLIPLAMIPWFAEKRLSIFAAFLIGLIIYLIVNRRFFYSAVMIMTTIIVALNNQGRIAFSFSCRPYVWKELIKRIVAHPIVGEGFDHTLAPANAIFNYKDGGIFMHNDLLNLGRCLGVLSIILVLWFVFDTLKIIGKSRNLIIFNTFILCSLFQMTMPIPWKAAIMLTAISLTIKESIKEAV